MFDRVCVARHLSTNGRTSCSTRDMNQKYRHARHDRRTALNTVIASFSCCPTTKLHSRVDFIARPPGSGSYRCSLLTLVAPCIQLMMSVSKLNFRHDTIEQFNVDSKAECGQLNVAYAARNKQKYKKETKTNKRQCPLSSVQVKIRQHR